MEEFVFEVFVKVQLFLFDWYVNNFVGVIVCKIFCGMWVYDMMSDILFIGIFLFVMIIFVVMFQMVLCWFLVGGFIFVVVIIFMVFSVVLVLWYVVLVNWYLNDVDLEIGVVFVDVIFCNVIVKLFGVEDCEESCFWIVV